MSIAKTWIMKFIGHDGTVKFCRDCKYCVVPATNNYYYAKCVHERAQKSTYEYLVSGPLESQEFSFASTMRMYSCGKRGKLWERKA